MLVRLARRDAAAVRGWRAAGAGRARHAAWLTRHSVAASTAARLRARRAQVRAPGSRGPGRRRGPPSQPPQRARAHQQRAVSARNAAPASRRASGKWRNTCRTRVQGSCSVAWRIGGAMSSLDASHAPLAGSHASVRATILLAPLGGRPMAGHQVLVLRIGVRVPAPQLIAPARCAPASWNSICGVSAPTVLILAAGQGTRMRSSTPKVLHELCGRPMVLWPVRAALEAGAGRVVVVDSPARALERCCRRAWSWRCRSSRTAPAARCGRRWRARSADGPALDPAAPVVVLSGDVPLVSAEAIGS